MRNENETSQPSQADAIRDEIAQMRESVELTRSDIRRTKNDIEQYQDAHESHVRRTRALWAIVILLVVGLAGLSWYGSPIFVLLTLYFVMGVALLADGFRRAIQERVSTSRRDRVQKLKSSDLAALSFANIHRRQNR